MRTTITLDPDVAELVKRAMSERGLTFKQAVNDAIRAGEDAGEAEPVSIPTFSMGTPRVDLTKALQVAADLEDEELVRKLEQGR